MLAVGFSDRYNLSNCHLVQYRRLLVSAASKSSLERLMPAPPAAPVVGALLRLVVESTCNAQRCQTVLDYLAGAGGLTPTITDLTNFVTAWRAAHETHYLACISDIAEVVSYTVSELHYGTTPTVVIPQGGGGAGTGGASALPLETAATITKYSGLKGKHGRGRVSMPAVPLIFTNYTTDSNLLNNTGLTAYSALFTPMLTPLASGLLGPWSFVISTRPTPPAVLITQAQPVTSIFVRTVLGTARRRKIGRGI